MQVGTGSSVYGHNHINNPPPVSTAPRQLGQHDYNRYFSVPKNDQAVDRSYENHNVQTRTLPEAYIGQSDFWGNTFELLTLTKNNFLIAYILPVVQTNQLRSHWNNYEFPPFLPDIVPERGVVRLVSSNRTSGGKALVRYGIGAMWEHTYLGTEAGGIEFLMNIHQINQSINELLQFDVLYTLLTVESETVAYVRSMKGEPFQNKKMMDVMKTEIDDWAILQQNPNAWKLMNAKIDHANSKYNPSPLTTYIVDERISMFLTQIPKDQTQYWLAGPRAVATVSRGVQDYRTDEWGNRVYTTHGYLTDGDVINPLQQPTQIGEFIFARDRYEPGLADSYTSKCRSVQYWDQGKNSLQTMSLQTMLDNCHRFDQDGNPRDFQSLPHPGSNGHGQKELGIDFLHHIVDGVLTPVSYFGHINRTHMSARHYMNQADVVLSKTANTMGMNQAMLERALNNYTETVRQAANGVSAEALSVWLAEVVKENTDNVQGGLQRNTFGSLKIPKKPEGANYHMPPTHLDYNGGKTIAQMVIDKTWGDTGFSEEQGKRVKEGIEVIDVLVPSLQRMFPDSIFLDKNWAADQANASAEYVFTENLILNGIGKRPVHYRAEDDEVYLLEDEDRNDVSQNLFIGDNILQQPRRSELTKNVQSVLPASTQFRKLLHETVIGQIIPAPSGRGMVWSENQESAGGEQKQNSFLQKYAMGNDLSGSPVALGSPVADYHKTFEDLIRYSELYRPDDKGITTRDSLQNAISGEIKRALVLSTLAMASVDEQDPDTSMKKIGAVMKHIENTTNFPGWQDEDVKVVDSGKLFKISENRYIGAVVKFARENPTFFALTDRVEDEDQLIAGVAQIKSQLEEVVRSARSPAIQALFQQSDEGIENSMSYMNKHLSQLQDEAHLYKKLPIHVGSRVIREFPSYIESFSSKSTDPIPFWPSSKNNDSLPISGAEIMHAASLLKRPKRGVMSPSEENIHADRVGYEFLPSHIADKHAIRLENIPLMRIASNMQDNDLYREQAAERQRVHDENMRSRTAYTNKSALLSGMTIPGSSSIGFDFGGNYSRKASSAIKDIDTYNASNIIDQGRFHQASTGRPIDDAEDFLRHMTTVPEVNVPQKKSARVQRVPIEVFDDGNLRIKKKQDTQFAHSISDNMKTLYNEINGKGIGKKLNEAVATVYLGTPVTREALQATIDHNILHPFNYILARPHILCDTLQAIKMIPGLPTGRCNLGHINVEIGNDAATGVQMLGVHFYAAAEVRKRKNVFVKPNVMVVGYNGGLGSGFYRNDGSYNPNMNEFGEEDDSFFAFAVPPEERVVSNPITLDGCFDWVDSTTYPVQEIKPGFPLTHSTAPYYTRLWNFAEQRWNRPLNGTMYNKYQVGERSIPNAMCFESLCLVWDPERKMYVIATRQTGHWHDNSFDARARVSGAAFDHELKTTM